MTKQEEVSIEEAARKTADYLYTLPDDCPPQLAKAISTLRQLINEVFVDKDKTVSSQFIYDHIYPAIKDIFVEEMMKIIGEDESTRTEVRRLQKATGKVIHITSQNPKNVMRNKLRAEQRAALIKKYGKS